MVVRIASLDVLLSAVEDWLASQQLCKDAPYSPDINGLGVMPGPQQQLWGSVPECHHHGVQVCQGFQRRVKKSGKPHISNLNPPSLRPLPHHKNIGRLQVSVQHPVSV